MSDAALLLLTAVLGAAALAGLAVAERTSRVRGGLSRAARTAGVAAALAFVAMATLTPSTGDEGSRLRLDPTEGLDQPQGLGNILLFVPLGGFLALLGLRARRAVLVATAVSLAVEIIQFAFVAGRYASTGDVVLNGIGAALGHLAVAVRSRGRRRVEARS